MPTQVIKGEVIVSKSPSTHPGDIRKVKCIDVPELRYLVNVIVFSKFGKRPLCNKLSCGDLDGDEYFVCWDNRLVK